MRFLATSSFFLGSRYEAVEPNLPVVIDVHGSVEPSRKWAPLDKAAQDALRKLGVVAPIASVPPTVRVVEGQFGRPANADVKVAVEE